MPITGLHLFHIDLSVEDNYSIAYLLTKCDNILFLFLIDPQQFYLNNTNKLYFSESARDFLYECLIDLDEDIRRKTDNKNCLHIRYKAEFIDFCVRNKIDVVGWNALYSIYSLKRDNEYKAELARNGIGVYVDHSHYLIHPVVYVNDKPVIYRRFGDYYKYYSKLSPPKSKNNNINHTKTTEKPKPFHIKKKKYWIEGTRECLKDLIKKFRTSKQDENSMHSAHLQFGTMTVRQAYYMFPEKKRYKIQTFWRSYMLLLQRFYTGHFDYKTVYKTYDPRFLKIKWKNNATLSRKFWEGNSGLPIIDAFVRQLIKMNYMLNRGRLLVSFAAIKLLHDNPLDDKYQWSGALVFGRLLRDGSSFSNNNNWLFQLGIIDYSGFRFGKAGSFGGRKYDISVKYNKQFIPLIKEFIPELSHLLDKELMNWEKYDDKEKKRLAPKYPTPILDYDKRLAEWYKLTKI